MVMRGFVRLYGWVVYFDFLLSCFVCVCGGGILPVYMSVYLVHAVPTEARKCVKPLELELTGESSKARAVVFETGSQLPASLRYSLW